MYSRREILKVAAAGLAIAPVRAAAKINSVVSGVRLGAQSYSFRDRSLDAAIKGFVEDGLGECELFSPGHVEPRLDREALRKWLLTEPLDTFRAVKKKFDDAGVELYAYNLSFKDDFTDEEIDRSFEAAHALGVGVITASSTVSCAKRLVPFVTKHKISVAFHGHSDVRNPNEFAKPESFFQALEMSPRFAVNLDIGHFWAANYNPVEFIEQYHDRILVLHLKDRKKDQGPNVPWGQGDTPIKEVLQLLKQEKYPIRAYIEYEYPGKEDAVVEVKRCFDYCKQVLA
jgi:sugar phosphate isomerase/epimerase